MLGWWLWLLLLAEDADSVMRPTSYLKRTKGHKSLRWRLISPADAIRDGQSKCDGEQVIFTDTQPQEAHITITVVLAAAATAAAISTTTPQPLHLLLLLLLLFMLLLTLLLAEQGRRLSAQRRSIPCGGSNKEERGMMMHQQLLKAS
jgi:hypothetical protein